jgi:site-specific DNA-cytosine methylase
VTDKKKSAQTYVMANHMPQHMFKSSEEHIAGEGYCLVHRGQCSIAPSPPCDLLVAGLPCHPFTKMRHKSSTKQGRKGKAPTHPDFVTTFESFPAALRSRKPGTFLVEQVPALQEICLEWGHSYLDEFMRLCAGEGYACRAVLLRAGDWLDWPRDRHRFTLNMMPIQTNQWHQWSLTQHIQSHSFVFKV